jgi:hypothetical protein
MYNKITLWGKIKTELTLFYKNSNIKLNGLM